MMMGLGMVQKGRILDNKRKRRRWDRDF